eukprot:SAG22_NODE_3543_length_1651_cov_1.594716_2_plen_65_part_00
MMYPGKCNCKGTNTTGGTCCNDGKGGFTYVLVVPEDPVSFGTVFLFFHGLSLSLSLSLTHTHTH